MGSEYEISDEVFERIFNGVKNFVDTNSPGTIIEHSGRKMRVTARTNCMTSERGQSCEVELQELVSGGYANIEIDQKIELRDDRVEKTNEVRITGADFPYPLEFMVAKEKMDIPVVESEDWCIAGESTPLGEFCSKRRW
jgi:hypothetical protein